MRNAPNRTRRDTDVSVSDDDDELAPIVPTEHKPLQVAVVGRPNAGKSTLINKILGEDRLLTGPEAGNHPRCHFAAYQLGGARRDGRADAYI